MILLWEKQIVESFDISYLSYVAWEFGGNITETLESAKLKKESQ
jgi:hypothetical protein